jgi:hypothetical protein
MPICNNLVEKVNASKIKLLVIDVTGKKYKSKWVKLKKNPQNIWSYK